MPWARLDDGFWRNPKVTATSTAAVGVYALGISYCADQLTDGFIPESIAVHMLARRRRALIRELVAREFWVEAADGYQIRDFLDYNPSKAEVDFRRRTNTRRQALHRDRTLVEAVRARDGDVCRYCNREVDFTDRRSPAGGTYDHVDPGGLNELDNVVVACRGCNSAKGRRTPAQAGLVLVPFQSGSNPDLNGTKTPVPSRPEKRKRPDARTSSRSSTRKVVGRPKKGDSK